MESCRLAFFLGEGMNILRTASVFLVFCLFGAGSGAVRADHGHGHAHGGVAIVLDPFWGPWYYPPGHHPYPPYYPPVLVAPSAPPVYVERDGAASPSAPPAAYWHYCEAARGYYPYVKDCPGGWLKVAPQPPGPR